MANNYNTGHGILLEEATLFERSRSGARGVGLPQLDVPAVDCVAHFGAEFRSEPARLPEVSEPEVVRHFTRLSTWNYSIDLGIFPLGSCTMKHNPRFNEAMARSESVCNCHPYESESWTQGHLQILHEVTEDLKAITGMAGVTLQPAAGAHGEYTGLAMIAAYHRNRGRARSVILAPDTSHGTNPASAALAGFRIVPLKTGEDGVLHPEVVRAALTDEVAGLMITNPNTLGVFETHIREIADILHAHDSLLYIDGANLNAIMGIVRPGDFGADVIQLNLHKTFSTPHGGGGPGSGPVGVSERMLPFLPVPWVKKVGERYCFENDAPLSIGRVKSFYGNYGVVVRAWCYIRAMGADGLRRASEDAILNANYLKARLSEYLEIPMGHAHLHEVVFNDKRQRESGLDTTILAKRLIDYGVHPPTMHFPLLVKNAIMIEPTETEELSELDRFIEAIVDVVRAESHPAAPTRVFREKIDEALAARQLKLRHEF